MFEEQMKKLRESSKKRNFTQRFDLIINLKDFNTKKAENRLDEILVLPKPIGKESSITIFSDQLSEIENCQIIKGSEIEKLGINKKELKKIISQTTFFFSDPKLMPIVGKHLGKFLAPIGKMPRPIAGDSKKMIESFRNAVKIEVKKQPMIQVSIGSENMKDEEIEENIKTIINFLKSKLPKGKNNISAAHLKLTMSKPIKLGAK